MKGLTVLTCCRSYTFSKPVVSRTTVPLAWLSITLNESRRVADAHLGRAMVCVPIQIIVVWIGEENFVFWFGHFESIFLPSILNHLGTLAILVEATHVRNRSENSERTQEKIEWQETGEGYLLEILLDVFATNGRKKRSVGLLIRLTRELSVFLARAWLRDREMSDDDAKTQM